jgi:ABC-2 type transport system permease protein
MSPVPPACQTGMTLARHTRRAGGRRPPAAARAQLPQALQAEWTKLRTVAGTHWLLAAAITLTVTVGAAVAAATRCPAGPACPVDTARLSLTGVQLGQAVIAVLATAAICGEYSTGMIRVTLSATPRRSAVLAAKATILTVLVLAAGAIAVAGSVLAGQLILPSHGFTAARGYPPLSPADGPLLRAAAGSVLYLALIALLSLGVATIIRDSAAAIGAVLGLLYLPPIIAAVLASNPTWQQQIDRWAPTNAGLTIQHTTNLHNLPITPWAGLGVLAAWAAAALLTGGLVLRLRDA